MRNAMKLPHSFIKALILIVLGFLLPGNNALCAEKVVTRINIETTDRQVKVGVASTGEITWKLVRQKAALAFCISPVDPDPNTPKEIPINSGLVRKVRFSQQSGRNLLVIIDVIPFPAFTVTQNQGKKGITITLERETMEGRKGPRKTPQAAPRTAGRKYSLLFNAAASEKPHDGDPPLVMAPSKEKIDANKHMFYKKESKSLIGDLAVIRKAAAGNPPPRQASTSSLISREFVGEDLVRILKFLADKAGLNLITAPQVRGTKSVVIDDMTAMEAIPLVLKGTPFSCQVQGTILFIGPSDAVRRLIREQELPQEGEEESRVFILKKVKASSMTALLAEKYPSARVLPYGTTNAIVITAVSSLLKEIEAFITRCEGLPAQENPDPHK